MTYDHHIFALQLHINYVKSSFIYKAYDLIKKLEPKIDEEEAKELIEFIEASKSNIITKSDLQLLRTDLQLLRTELENKIENILCNTDGTVNTICL